ncbi:MAG: hypothetical protein J6W29_06660 [Neisseriaceae bacterium]|nr:hypothetical protein [Neisseriaceae bacterium]
MSNNLFGQGKTLALFSMQDVNIDVVMVEELKKYGFEVISINQDKKQKFHYPNMASFLYCKYRKIIYKDKQSSRYAKS